MPKRSHGTGSVQRRGENSWRLRYYVDDVRQEVTFRGTRKEAQAELVRRMHSAHIGEHVTPSRVSVGQWIEQWIKAGAPGRKRKRVSQRTVERYEQLLQTHVKPTLGDRPLQQLKATEIDTLYVAMATAGEISPRTQHHVHVVLGACLATATRKGMIVANPMLRVEQIPNPEQVSDDEPADDEIGEGLDEEQLKALVDGFKPSPHFSLVALASATGARRNELLALRWTDLDTDAKTIRIERAWEQTKKFGLRLKAPKTKRGYRTIEIAQAAIDILLADRERYLRLCAGVPDDARVDLSLVRLPAKALIFPNVEAGTAFDFEVPRNPRNFSKEFARRADLLGFGTTRFHDFRGIHSTALLDSGVPVHIVAQRIGDDPAVLLRNYVKRKRTKAADASLSTAIGALAKFLVS